MKLLLLSLAVFIVSYLIAPVYIRWLKSKQFGQFIREEGPQEHKKKKGTPTMGAFIFLMPIIIFSLFLVDWSNPKSLLVILTIVLFGIIGGIDDFAKITKKQNEGLTSKQKMGLQIVFSLLIYFLFLHGVKTEINIPFTDASINLGILFPLFSIVLIIGASNATNLTDGLDGLLTGNAIVSFIGFAIIAFLQGNQLIMATSIFFIAGLLAFLVYNFNPAKVFMGDAGSLVLGAVMAVMAIQLKIEIYLVFLGLIYVVETLSVILQVASFKTTGKRIFKMSPIHHHFELNGMNEKSIFRAFVMVQLLFVVIAVIGNI